MVAAVMMAGCEVGEGELMKTKTGHQMYCGWTDDINKLLTNIVEPAFNLYAWAQAPDEQKQEIWRRHFYSNATVEVFSDHAWELSMDDHESLRMSLEYGASFSEVGGKMRMVYSSYKIQNNFIEDILFILENKGNGVWELYSDDGNIRFTFTLGTTEIPESLAETSIKVEGHGTFTHKNIIQHCLGDDCTEEVIPTYLSYNILEPFEGYWGSEYEYFESSFVTMFRRLEFSSGKVKFQATDENGDGNIATISVLNPEEIEIEMDGIVQRRKV